MKKGIKVIIAGAIIIGIGLAVLLIALGLNGWSFTPDFTTEEFTSTQENTALDVTLDAGSLKIEYHDADDIQISYPTAKSYKTEITESNGKLTVNINKHRWFTFGWGISSIPETVIRIPKDTIRNVEIKLNAGSATLADGAFDNVTINLNAGTLTTGKITECNVLNVHVNAGTANIGGAQCNELLFKLNAGSANIRDIDSMASTIKVNAGSAHLSFADAAENYTASVNVSAGSCNGLSDRTGGEKRIDVKVNAGSVNVSFAP